MSIMTKTKRTPKRLRTIRERVINFTGKSWQYIMEAYERLHDRYKMKVSLSKIRPMGAGIFTGFFTVA